MSEKLLEMVVGVNQSLISFDAGIHIRLRKLILAGKVDCKKPSEYE